jgi:uncharacterized protein with beta-barrel porin domain
VTINSLSQIAGQGSAAVTQSSSGANNVMMNMMLDPANASRNDGAGEGAFTGAALGYAAAKRDGTDAFAAVDRRVSPFGERWSVWGSAYGGNSTVNGNTAAGTATTSSRSYGATAGVDYRVLPNTTIGFALGGATINFNTDAVLSSGRSDIFQAGIFARHTMGAAYVSAALAYSWQNVSTDRTVTVSGTDRLHAGFNANTFSARGEAGYRFATAFAGLAPYAALQATTFMLPGYSESATSGSTTFAMVYSSNTTTSIRSELGLRADKPFLVNDGIITVRTRAAWAHDSNTDRPVTAAFQTLSTTTFAVNGAQASANAALVTAGVEMKWRNGWTVAGTFEGEFSSTTRSYAGKGTVKYGW